MKTLRHNIYDRVHKDLRTLVLDAGLKIQKTDFGKAREAEATIKMIRKVVGAYELHVHKVDTRIFHAVASMAPYIIAMFEKANAKNLQLGITIAEMADQYENLKSRSERIKHGSYLQMVFFEFTATVLQSMNKAENVVNELLWVSYDDTELMMLERLIQAIIINKEKAQAVPGTLKKESDFSRWFREMFDSASPLITTGFTRIARNLLPSSSSFKILTQGG